MSAIRVTRRQWPANRRGSALVEFAVCAPIMILFVFGAIEITNMIFLKQALTSSAYEAARVAIQGQRGAADARRRAEEVLVGRGVDDSTVVFDPVEPRDAERGTPIRVTVSASAAENSVGPQRFSNAMTLSASVNMVKE